MSTMREQYLGNGDGGNVQRPTSPPMERIIPNAMEAEEAVLGSMMIGGAVVVEEVRAKLPNAEAFLHPNHRVIFNYLLAAVKGGMAIDPLTFTQALRDGNELENVGGVSFITHLFTMVPTASNVGYYIATVREKWLLRTIIYRCTETIRRAYDKQDDVEGLLNDHVGNVIEIGQMASPVEAIRHIREFVPGAVQEIEATYHSRGRTIGLSSGFVDLDRMTGGFQAPLSYYFAGRPAMGKSSVMVEVAEHIAIENAANGNNVGIFSVEMTGRQLAKRMICSIGDINLQRLRDGFLAKDTLPKMKAAAEKVESGHIWIDDSAISIFEFRARARRMVTKMKCKVIIIDYLQRMHSTSRRAQGNREQEMNEIAQGISATAKELNVPIIVLAQLNRKSEDRSDKVPALSDLRESGSIEQEARFVGLLHRPSYYIQGGDMTSSNEDKADEDGATRDRVISQKRLKKMWPAARLAGLKVPEKAEDGTIDGDWIAPGEDRPWTKMFEEHAELIVAKQNEGPVGTINLRFVKEFARFENVTEKLYSNNPAERQGGTEEDDF